MGIVLKRRDNAPIVKDIYGGIIDILMKDKDIEKSIVFLKSMIQQLVDEKVPVEKLIISKSLRSFYKNPKQIAHNVLAERIGVREPGNKPAPGDRIPYIYIETIGKKLQGEKIETPKFIKDHKLKIDYGHYITNQIAKPIAQVCGLEVEKLPGVTRSALLATSKAKDPVAAREALAQSLLFDKLLLEASRTPETMERSGQTSIATFFKM
jgi:DNA polymerase elongation subunit (family B)